MFLISKEDNKNSLFLTKFGCIKEASNNNVPIRAVRCRLLSKNMRVLHGECGKIIIIIIETTNMVD